MSKFCSNCGTELNDEQVVCLKCGVAVKKKVVESPDSKSKVIAGLLGIFFGTFGVHNFYLGFKSKAVTQLLLTILTCGIGALITGPWSLIESILILTGSINKDANGNDLKE